MANDGVKRLSPFDAVFGYLEMASEAALYGEPRFRRDKFNDKWDGITVDTCAPSDTGEWETGIQRDGAPWVIVEQYRSRAEAETGHARWVAALKDDRNQDLVDIDLYGEDESRG